MSSVTPAMVKTLRTRTGAGLMDCKKALGETGGDIDAAIDWLRKKGTLKAAAKAGRASHEGLVALAVEGGRGALAELNCETDFVARNDDFRQAARGLAELALKEDGELETLLQANWPDSSEKAGEHITALAAKLGENIQAGRIARIKVEGGVLGAYLHNRMDDQTGRIAVLAAMKGGDEKMAGQIAMHIAAAQPIAVKAEDIPPAVLEREKSVLEAQAREEGKPEAIAAKIVEGRLARFRKEQVLLEQDFVVDDSKSVGKVLGDAEITGFLRFAVGEDAPA